MSDFDVMNNIIDNFFGNNSGEKIELISREGVLRCLKAYNQHNIAIDELPIIESRPKGKWIKESDYKVMGDGYMWNCSECGNRVYVDSNGLFPNYCEDCGADMRGEE